MDILLNSLHGAENMRGSTVPTLKELDILIWTSTVAIVGIWMYYGPHLLSKAECQTSEMNTEPMHPTEWASKLK